MSGYDLQRASFLKRISAYILDLILITIVFTGALWLISTLLDIDKYGKTIEDIQNKYAEEYSVENIISCSRPEGAADTTKNRERYEKTVGEKYKEAEKPEGFDSLSEEEKNDYKDNWIKACDEFGRDERVRKAYMQSVNMMIIAVTFSLLAAFLILEFIVPVILKNGQTLGKKIFSLGVMRIDGVKLDTMLLFVRTVLGKYTIETMIPFFIAFMVLQGIFAFSVGVIILVGMLVLQIILIAASEYRAPIHDSLAKTVVVDLSSQLIFENKETMLEYKMNRHKESIEKPECP